MCSAQDDYHITVPPLYENMDDEKYQPFPPPLSPLCTQFWGECPGTSDEHLEEKQKVGGLLLAQMEEEPVMQKDVSHAALDVERLVSENGIPALWNVLCNTAFKGQGYESFVGKELPGPVCMSSRPVEAEKLCAQCVCVSLKIEDLQILLGEIELWGRRMYPEEPFDALIRQLEDICVQGLHQNLTSACALYGSGFCEDTRCTMENVHKAEPVGEKDQPVNARSFISLSSNISSSYSKEMPRRTKML